MSFLRTVSEYRWPIYLGGLLTMSLVACGVIVFVATRPDSPRPIKGYYEAARAWDADQAVEDTTRLLRWKVDYDTPSDVPHYPGMPRPLDVRVVDRDGNAVTGLVGSVIVMRASDARLNQTLKLTELPQKPGTYRTLARLDQPGRWDLKLDAKVKGLRVVYTNILFVEGFGPAGRAE